MVVNLLAAALANCCAAEEGGRPSLVGTTNDLKDLIRWHLQGRPEPSRPRLATGWRDEVCGETLLDVLSGRRALRVTDPLSDVPVAVEDDGPGRQTRIAMKRIVSCFTNCFGADGVRAAAERLRSTGLDTWNWPSAGTTSAAW